MTRRKEMKDNGIHESHSHLKVRSMRPMIPCEPNQYPEMCTLDDDKHKKNERMEVSVDSINAANQSDTVKVRDLRFRTYFPSDFYFSAAPRYISPQQRVARQTKKSASF